MEQPRINKTRFAELGYMKQAPGLWRVVDISTATPAVVGPQYPTKDTLLADFARYAKESWGLE